MKKLCCILLALLLLLQFSVPVGATEPGAPTEPTEPTEPIVTEPADTTEPTDPTDPADPTEPTEPTDPADPTEPTEPTDPTDPTEPTEPEPREDENHKPYLSGYTDGSFRPNKTMTRAELAMIVYSVGDYPKGEPRFSDVPDNKWYTNAVNAVAEAGVFAGYADGSFHPNRAVIRAELVTVLRKLSGIDAPQNAAAFPDVKPSFWAANAIAIALEQGWVSGYPDGTFRPRDPVTRAEAVVMLNRFLDRHPDTEAIEAGIPVRFFPDNVPGKWYYLDVLEATTLHTAHYETPAARESWLDSTVASANLADGFYCIGKNLYAAEQGDLIHSAQSGILAGVPYTCTGDTGVCTVDTDVLRLANQELVLIRSGRPLYVPGKYPDGFYARSGKLYAAMYGFLIRKAKTGTLNGVSFSCKGESGICTARTEALSLVTGEVVLLSGGNLLCDPGAYPNGFYVKGGQLYAARDGFILCTAGSDTLNGVSFSCTGSSGVCTAPDWNLLPLSGISISCFSAGQTAEAAWTGTRNVSVGETLLAAIHVYERYFRVEYPLSGAAESEILQRAQAYGILDGPRSDLGSPVTRGDAAKFLRRSMRGRELAAINVVTAIPDLNGNSPYYSDVMCLYRAGVMGGVGAERSANVGGALPASELAALLHRLELPDARLHFKLPDKVIETIQYGTSGSGSYPLTAYRIGTGKNVMILSFAIHGWEDNWNRDGQSLVYLADQLKSWLDTNYALVQQNNWTVYIMRCLNPDGLYLGTTCNGPGRCTTTYYNASGQLISGKGIDMNRSFPYAFQAYTGNRNFNGTAPLQCAEARAIANFVSARKGSGFNILVDTHGWFGQIITSGGKGTLYNAFLQQFPNSSYASLYGAHGYFSAWAAYVKGFDACLLELPRGITSHNAFLNAGCVWRFENVIKYLLQHYNGPASTRTLPDRGEPTGAILDGN